MADAGGVQPEPALSNSKSILQNKCAGLPAMTECQPKHLWLTYRYRGQARSHFLNCVGF